jgi:Fe2+ transport system protein FeoA
MQNPNLQCPNPQCPNPQNSNPVTSGELPLSRLEQGYSAYISRIQTRDRNTLKKLLALGFLPGCEVRMRQNFPAYVVELGHSQYAIDRYVAEQILVQKQA